MNEEKTIDNKLVDNKAKLKVVNDKIDIERQKMKNLDEIEELFVSLNSNINKCVELLSKSMKGENIGRKLGAIEESNKVNFNKSIYSINSNREDIKKKLSELSDQKDEVQELIREENRVKLEEEKREREERNKESE